MPLPRLRVVADDLSGAAECAAALARAGRAAAPLVLKGAFPVDGSWSTDIDSRAMPAAEAAHAAALGLRRAAADLAPGNLVFKKIDSTLRGHVGAELRAALGVPHLMQAAVVCPALPAQGRSLQGGVLHVDGEPLLDRSGRVLDLVRLLAEAGAQPLLVRPAPGASSADFARAITEAVDGGTRVLVVDASDDDDLRRLARGIAAVPASMRLLPVGAAGLAEALAADLLAGGSRAASPVGPPPAGCFVAMVGSFSPVTTRQVDVLASQADVHAVRLEAATWLSRPQLVTRAIAQAATQLDRGRAVVLSACGTVPAESTRELVRSMAAAAEPLIRRAATLLLTGGDTARAVLDRLGVERLQVLGELEAGICLSRETCGTRSVVTKAGGFGDAGSLLRVLRHFRPMPLLQPVPERKE